MLMGIEQGLLSLVILFGFHPLTLPLFLGFDRTRAISRKPAEKVAQAAQAFGQEDDITVLTLTMAPAGVPHA
jgi:hypothetical protein